MSDRGFFITLQAIRRQLAAMPNNLYFIRLIDQSTRRVCPGERLWDVGQLLCGSAVRFLRACNCQGYDVYLLPYADDCNPGYILLDLDRAPTGILGVMRANGHEPCVMLRTSPGHLQAWIRVSTTPLEPTVATAVGKQLARTYGGDMASTDWRHLGRLAGFTNQKLERRVRGYAPWVKIVEAQAVLASAAQDLLYSATQGMTQETTAAVQDITHHHPTITAQGAVSIYQRWMKRWHIREHFSPPDWSIVDCWLARKLLAIHIPAAQVETILRLGSPHFPRHHGDPEDYLRRTLARAALAAPRTVCSTHAAAPCLPEDETDGDCSNSKGER